MHKISLKITENIDSHAMPYLSEKTFSILQTGYVIRIPADLIIGSCVDMMWFLPFCGLHHSCLNDHCD